MAEINPIGFRYDPIPGRLYYDSGRTEFYIERTQDVIDTLQYLCFCYNVVRELKGAVWFSADESEPPEIREIDYADPTQEEPPFPGERVKLW